MKNTIRNAISTVALSLVCFMTSPISMAQGTDVNDLYRPLEPWLVVTSDGEVIDTSRYLVTRIDDRREVMTIDDSSAMVDNVEPWETVDRESEVTDSSRPTDAADDVSYGMNLVDNLGATADDSDPSAGAVADDDPTQNLVFGSDNRLQVSSRVYPYSAIVKINTDATAQFKSRQCSGTLISPRVVLTAGHCVYDTTTDKWLPAATVRTMLAFDGGDLADSIKLRASTGGRYHSLSCFVSGHDPECDVGVIRLDQPINVGRTGLIGWYFNTKDSVWTNGQPYWVSGYPAMAKGVSTKAQWSSNGPILQARKYVFWTQIDSSAGQSGEPLYYKGCPFNCNGPFLIVGVDAHDITVNNATKWNEAIRITPWLSNIMATWAALP